MSNMSAEEAGLLKFILDSPFNLHSANGFGVFPVNYQGKGQSVQPVGCRVNAEQLEYLLSHLG